MTDTTAEQLPEPLTAEQLAADPGRLLWPDEVAAILGLKDTDSLRAVAGRSRKLAREGKLADSDLPPNDTRALRKVKTGAGIERTVWQAQWKASTIAAYLPHRRTRGNPDWISRGQGAA